MGKKQLALFSYMIAAICIINFISCSKESTTSNGGNNTPPLNPPDTSCKIFTITQTTTVSDPCTATGTIQASATGSNQFMFRLNSGGTFQSSGNFNNVAAGNYTLFVKDSAGCQQSVAVTVSTPAAGPLFTNVKNLLAASCVSCHNAGNPNGNNNWNDQCRIISQGLDIQSQVNQNLMPQGGPALSSSQKAIINDWIAAGGGYSN